MSLRVTHIAQVLQHVVPKAPVCRTMSYLFGALFFSFGWGLGVWIYLDVSCVGFGVRFFLFVFLFSFYFVIVSSCTSQPTRKTKTAS